jgi:hypothetical protein
MKKEENVVSVSNDIYTFNIFCLDTVKKMTSDSSKPHAPLLHSTNQLIYPGSNGTVSTITTKTYNISPFLSNTEHFETF